MWLQSSNISSCLVQIHWSLHFYSQAWPHFNVYWHYSGHYSRKWFPKWHFFWHLWLHPSNFKLQILSQHPASNLDQSFGYLTFLNVEWVKHFKVIESFKHFLLPAKKSIFYHKEPLLETSLMKSKQPNT